MRRATLWDAHRVKVYKFLSTLSLRRATPERTKPQTFFWIFLSTLSLRRATPNVQIVHVELADFYPRSPCGERPNSGNSTNFCNVFLSTLSLRRATKERKVLIADVYIFLSTLSLRRATTSHDTFTDTCPYFYPRSPCGERPLTALPCSLAFLFLSTLSLRRATEAGTDAATELLISIHALLAESDHRVKQVHGRIGISIHALLAESDESQQPCGHPTKDFYPRSPCGERHPVKSESLTTYLISIHALLAESDMVH